MGHKYLNDREIWRLTLERTAGNTELAHSSLQCGALHPEARGGAGGS
jgi:hypothetical protein